MRTRTAIGRVLSLISCKPKTLSSSPTMDVSLQLRLECPRLKEMNMARHRCTSAADSSDMEDLWSSVSVCQVVMVGELVYTYRPTSAADAFPRSPNLFLLFLPACLPVGLSTSRLTSPASRASGGSSLRPFLFQAAGLQSRSGHPRWEEHLLLHL